MYKKFVKYAPSTRNKILVHRRVFIFIQYVFQPYFPRLFYEFIHRGVFQMQFNQPSLYVPIQRFLCFHSFGACMLTQRLNHSATPAPSLFECPGLIIDSPKLHSYPLLMNL